uniref:Uncharacterized protein n=1 Tax=Mycolicibacterium mucogenicum DSM 44124 TaxID=1226753 RepID=A0A8H2JGN3_MYCMU
MTPPFAPQAIFKLLAMAAGGVCAPLRLLPRKAGVRQATVPPSAPSDTTSGEAGATAPAPASPFRCTSRLFAGIPDNFFCTRNLGHDGKHGYAGIFWTDDEAVR